MSTIHDRRAEARKALAGALLVTLTTAACGGAATESMKAADPAPVKVSTAEARPAPAAKAPARLATRGPDDPFPGLYAHFSGTLVVTEDNCVAATTAEDTRPHAIVWGHGWSVREENGKAAVYDAEGRLFAREGDRVGLAGGSADRRAGTPCADEPGFEANDTQAAG